MAVFNKDTIVVTSFHNIKHRFPGDYQNIEVEIKSLGGTLIDIDNPFELNIKQEIIKKYNDNTKQILIIGGHQIIPFGVLENPAKKFDSDTLYTDDVYADINGDKIIDVPICRIPDGKDIDLLYTQLTQSEYKFSDKPFAIANRNRKFAEDLFHIISDGLVSILWSEPVECSNIPRSGINASVLYLMLHGEDEDTSLWWGECVDHITGKPCQKPHTYHTHCPVAFIENRAISKGIIFSGTCYGAYIFEPHHNPGNSICLNFLKHGTRCFIGCTGIHYSTQHKETHYNGPLFHKLFLNELKKGSPSLNAFFYAKTNYLSSLKRPTEIEKKSYTSLYIMGGGK